MLVRGIGVVHGCAEGIILVQMVEECTVIINLDGRRIELVASHEYALLAERERPLGARLPVDPEEVGGIERILFVDLLVHPLAYAETDIVRQMTFHVDVEVISLEMRVVNAVLRLLVERGAGIDRDLIDVRLLCLQRGRAEETCRQQECGRYVSEQV